MGTVKEAPWNDLYTLVGECIHVWSGVETALSTLFVVLHDREPGDYNDPLRATFERVISFEVRLDMLLATVNADSRCTVYAPHFNALKNKLSKSYKRRHTVAHFTLVGSGMVAPGQPDYALQPFFTMRTFLKKTGANKLKACDLQLLVDSFSLLASRVHRHSLYIRQTRGLPVSDHARIDDPDLLIRSLSVPNPKAL